MHPNYYKRDSNYTLGAVIAIVILAIIALFSLSFYTTQLKQSDVTITVESKERIAEGNGGKYLVFTTDDEAFQVTDNIFFGKTESSNRYAALDEGKTYDCEAVGVRFSLLSLYKNLIDCEEVH
jgi:hypothetical protein